MAQVFWNPNGQIIAQVDTLTVTAVATGGVISATINAKTISYTMVAADTTATAAAALLTLLQATSSAGPAEFAEITFAAGAAGNQITCTDATPGTPFTMTTSATGGAQIVQAHTTPNSSNSDVANPQNWLRAGVPALPQNFDDIVLANSAVPLLWNLTALQNVQPNSFTRWQSHTGAVGLPVNNPNGYPEYRPTDLTFGSQAGSSPGPGPAVCNVNLGVGGASSQGQGPPRERYNFGGQQCAFSVFASGSAADDYAVHLLGTNPLNSLLVQGTSVGVAMLTGSTQTSNFASVTVDGGGTVSLGSGVSFFGTGNLLLTNGSAAIINCVPQTLTLQNGSSALVGGTNVASSAYANVNIFQNSRITWMSNAGMGNLVMQTGGVLDKSADLRQIAVASLTIDGDTCQVIDPNNTIVYTGPITVRNAVTSGPFVYTGPRQVTLK